MARKTANDYRKEYTDKVLKLVGVEARIKARALELCNAHPEVMIPLTIKDKMKKGGYSVKKFAEGIEVGMTADIETYLDVIQVIEEDNAKKHPHVQTTMFPK